MLARRLVLAADDVADLGVGRVIGRVVVGGVVVPEGGLVELPADDGPPGVAAAGEFGAEEIGVDGVVVVVWG